MERSVKILVTCSILILICLFFAGCSDNSDSGGSAPPETTAAVTETPLYTAGDIVWNSASTTNGWLIISYDAATDSYTRAFINKNPDGTWGYRSSPSTENAKRSATEKVYSVKVAHVTVSSVPTQVPTTVATTVATTKAATSTTTTAITTKTTAIFVQITGTDPEEGKAGETVITDIIGTSFEKNATVMLKHTGSTSITATNVVFDSSTKLTCTFEIPNTSYVGAWDVVVTNPDKSTDTLENFFLIHGET